jgi:hypothetical protein
VKIKLAMENTVYLHQKNTVNSRNLLLLLCTVMKIVKIHVAARIWCLNMLIRK